MLTEIAFTPAVFDQDKHEDKSDWRDQLKEILRSLAPRTGVSPIVVSNLYDSTWFFEVERSLRAVEDHKLKPVCQGLLTKLEERLVKRPICNDYPMDDAGWCREAIASHSVELIGRIVATLETRASLEDDGHDVRSLEELNGAGFWSGISDRASPRAFIEDQIVLQRLLCLHSGWVAYSNPYAAGAEMDFTIDFLKAALNRPPGFGGIEIEVHFHKRDVDATERQNQQDRTARYLSRQLIGHLTAPNCVKVFCWERLLERTLIAGDFTTDGDGVQRRRPRWGISMTHVARQRLPREKVLEDAVVPDAEPHRWRLMDKQELSAPFDRFLDHVRATRPTPSIL